MGDVVEPRHEFIQENPAGRGELLLKRDVLEESNFLRKESNCMVGESNYRVIRDRSCVSAPNIDPIRRPTLTPVRRQNLE
jgi:hypothetical protein